MRHTLESPTASASFSVLEYFPAHDAKDKFKTRFRCALAQCVRRGFQVEECFGVIWEETLEKVELSFRDQNDVYPELIEWARRWIQ
jgi:hypothetical protein